MYVCYAVYGRSSSIYESKNAYLPLCQGTTWWALSSQTSTSEDVLPPPAPSELSFIHSFIHTFIRIGTTYKV